MIKIEKLLSLLEIYLLFKIIYIGMVAMSYLTLEKTQVFNSFIFSSRAIFLDGVCLLVYIVIVRVGPSVRSQSVALFVKLFMLELAFKL